MFLQISNFSPSPTTPRKERLSLVSFYHILHNLYFIFISMKIKYVLTAYRPHPSSARKQSSGKPNTFLLVQQVQQGMEGRKGGGCSKVILIIFFIEMNLKLFIYGNIGHLKHKTFHFYAMKNIVWIFLLMKIWILLNSVIVKFRCLK